MPTGIHPNVMLRGVPILLYHRVGPRDGTAMDDYTVSPARFGAQMRFLARAGWEAVVLDEVLRRRASPARRVAITFDDGFASNREHAWPVLRELGLPATTFVVTGLVGGTNAWDDDSMPRYPLLAQADLRAADPRLMRFESHGATHASLSGAGEAELAREVAQSKSALEALLGRPVSFFAYPFGAWSPAVRQAVRGAGYRAACSCLSGRNGPRADPWLLRRVEIREEDVGARLRWKLATGLACGAAPLVDRLRGLARRWNASRAAPAR